jgi:hypothetical protein
MLRPSQDIALAIEHEAPLRHDPLLRSLGIRHRDMSAGGAPLSRKS